MEAKPFKQVSPMFNRLIDAMSAELKEHLLPHLELRFLPLGEVICEAGAEPGQVYFPLDAIVSLLYVTRDGASAEICVVGNDGIVGVSQFLGGASTPNRAVVQSAGHAYGLSAHRLKAEFSANEELVSLMLRYTQMLITQMAQTVVCNRYHTMQQQLCRWLLMSLDRLPDNKLTMTHELIANMLGVRREGVTTAAGRLQKLGLIHYSRGHITVLNRPALESRCCECYEVVKRECTRLMPGLPASAPAAERSSRASGRPA